MKTNSKALWICLITLSFLHIQKVEAKLSVNAIQMIDSNNGWAVGDDGLVLKWNGSIWNKVTLPFFTESDFYSLSFINSTTGFIAGQNGILLKYNGTTWQFLDVSSYDITSVSAIDANNVWIANINYVYFISNGVSDENYMLEAAPDTINSIYFLNSTTGWAVSQSGAVYPYLNGTWSYPPTITTKPLNSVYFINSNLGWAVGNNGAIYKYTGSWATETVSTTTNFHKVYMTSSTQGWATGDNGIIYSYNGSTWSQATFSGTSTVNGLSFLSSNNGYGVDKSGNLFTYNGTNWSSAIALPANANTAPSGIVFNLAGTINSVTNWNADTIKILAYTLLPKSTNKLILKTGATIDFAANATLTSNIPVVAVGSAIKPILFNNKNSNATGFWFNIIQTDIDTSFLQYCTFNNAGRAFNISHGYVDISNVLLNNCKYVGVDNLIGGSITNSTFNNLANQFFCDKSFRVLFKNDNFLNNASNGLFLRDSKNINIENCVLSKNASTGLYATNSILNLTNCKLQNNSGVTGGGMYLLNCLATVNNCLLTNNQCTGSTSNIIVPIYIGGGGICAYESRLDITNSTIAYNKSGLVGGGICSIFSSGNVYNTILWGNVAVADTNQFHLFSSSSGLNFYNSDIQFASADFDKYPGAIYSGTYLNNLNSRPLFKNNNNIAGTGVDGTTLDWSLKTNTPCYNKGINSTGIVSLPLLDLLGNKRVSNGIIDIGAYETYVSKISVCNSIAANTVWSADTVLLTCTLQMKAGEKLEILPGTKILASKNAYFDIGYGSIKAIGLK